MPRLTCWIAVGALLGALAATGCGAGPTSLSVRLTGGQPASLAPGQEVSFVITVTDTGVAGTSGLTVTADLPADFRYTDTGTVGGTAVRTSPVEAQGNSRQPTWGVWELSGHGDTVVIPFDARAGGNPGTYETTATASGATTGTAQSNALPLKLTPAPLLSATVAVSPSQATPGQDVTYEVGVFNSGTGPANGVSVTVSLPPVFVYNGGVQISGDSGRSNGTDPVEGTEIPYFDGFEVPPQSASGPGKLIIKFEAQVLSSAGAEGTYPCGVQVLGDAGVEVVELPDSAPVVVSR